MLFFVSVAIAVPFLLVANVLHNARPGDTVGSPLYLLLGIAGVVLAAAIGSAVGGRAGLFTAAGVAAVCWVALVVLCGIFSKEMQAVLPIHVLGSLATVAILAVLVWKIQAAGT
jgi:hypothetical protein